jgi:hypothetical protein
MKKTFLVILVGLLSAVCAQAETVYTKVSGKPVNDWPGTYIIVYEKSDTKALVWDGEESSGNYQEVTLSDGKITSEALADYQITVSKEGSNEYYVKAKNGYIGCGGGKNEITFTSGGHSCTIKSNGGYVQLETNTNTCRFLYYNGQGADRFRFYYDKDKKWSDTNKHNICFYVLGDVEQEDPQNQLDLNYAQADMYACPSQFPQGNDTYNQYYFTYLRLLQEEDPESVPAVELEIYAPTQYSIAGSYTYDNGGTTTKPKKYWINCEAGSKHSIFYFINKSEQGWGQAALRWATMKIDKIGPSQYPNAYKYHIKLQFEDTNGKIWTLDKDMDVFATWNDCDRSTKPESDMDPVAFELESGNHNTQEQGIESIQNSDIRIQKILIDGQMYILRGEKIYSVQGQMVR